MTCVLVDDVLYTGRTIRAAIEALFDYGRPRACSSPASPTAATASSRSVPTTSARTCRPRASERVQVQLVEIDEVDRSC
jgi:pyrimidine operon attenuation protein/uracil phosphoribosyltransferase